VTKLFLAALAVTAGMTVGSVHAAPSFPCRWNWSLFDGMRPGYVTAGNNADCTGRQGSLTLGVRVLKLNPATKSWQTVRTGTKTFKHLNGNRFVEVATRCAAASFRGVFRWTLRDARGTVVARHLVKTRSLVVTSPDCKLILGGPGTPPKASGPWDR
jgi:hypothetical protein